MQINRKVEDNETTLLIGNNDKSKKNSNDLQIDDKLIRKNNQKSLSSVKRFDELIKRTNWIKISSYICLLIQAMLIIFSSLFFFLIFQSLYKFLHDFPNTDDSPDVNEPPTDVIDDLPPADDIPSLPDINGLIDSIKIFFKNVFSSLILVFGAAVFSCVAIYLIITIVNILIIVFTDWKDENLNIYKLLWGLIGLIGIILFGLLLSSVATLFFSIKAKNDLKDMRLAIE